MNNTFGSSFRVTTWGESHGASVGCVVDGCPAGLDISVENIQTQLDRRRPGQSKISTPRNESDRVEILSGIFGGKTLGTPIALLVRNADQKSGDYDHLRDVLRPGHADWTWQEKFGHRDHRGGGRSSARETVGRVAAGAVARQFLDGMGVEILSWTEQVGDIRAEIDPSKVTLKNIEKNIVRCPDETVAKKMIAAIEGARDAGDSLGGVICGVIRGCPVGLGEPVFDKLPALLGHALLSINAVKGVEFGSGFAGAEMRGSEHNDEILVDADGKLASKTNHAGGTLGGISNGMDITFRVAFKPTATIAAPQQTIDTDGVTVELSAHGRHDPCVVPRAIPIVDAMTAITLADLSLR